MVRPSFTLVILLAAFPLAAQNLGPRPLNLPQDPAPAKGRQTAGKQKADPAKQAADLREQVQRGDKDAAFQLGSMYLIGQGVTQDPAMAEQLFAKAEMTPARKCFVAQAYMEIPIAGRVASAQRWANAADGACAYWEQAEWYRTLRVGPDAAKELELLKKGLAADDEGYKREIRARLGELILTGASVSGSPAERVAWIGEAVRQRVGTAEWAIGSLYAQHPEQTESPSTSVEWVRKAARYGIPRALVMVGQAIMTREISDLPYVEGLAFEELAMRQNPLGVPGKEGIEKQLQPEQREELADSVALWQRIAAQTGAFYGKGDALRMSETVDFAALEKAGAEGNPDAQLRLAFAYEAKGELAKAEGLYRTVWRDGAGLLWGRLASAAAKEGKWPWARQLYESAAGAGSHAACEEIARIDTDGLAGSKDPVSAEVWWQLAGKEGKSALTEEQKETVAVRVAQWKEKHPGW